ncbi:hypothetical protein BHM03_00053750, partial [Ensete ventricosum]
MQRLTGGVLILRNKFFIILYRGKDFLPGGVTTLIDEREAELNEQQLEEEKARMGFTNSLHAMDNILPSFIINLGAAGRRGIYDGVFGSIHQHWKHREVVKVLTKQKAFCHITCTARLLEVGSGGILVAVEKLRTSHAIIIYRGKNYARPLKPLNSLLSKREALQRSIEIQRRGVITSIYFFIDSLSSVSCNILTFFTFSFAVLEILCTPKREINLGIDAET